MAMASTNLMPSSRNLSAPAPSISTTHNPISSSSLSFPHPATSSPSIRVGFPRPVNPDQPRLVCRMCDYRFPDPIPGFADAETEKFREHMIARLEKKKSKYFGDSVEEIVDICTEILSNFLHTEYGGPGTLMVVPFIDMADAIRERELPGASQAARAAVVWAQNNIDKDWKEWTGEEDSD